MNKKETLDYETNLESGLTQEEVEQRIHEGLVNKQPDRITKTIPQIIVDNAFTLFNAFNFAIALILIFIGAYENTFFFIVIILNCLIGIAQEIRSKRLIEKLSLITLPHIIVTRNRKEKRIAVEDVVLNDLMTLSIGDQIGADAIVRGGKIEVNESLLTGEIEPILKENGAMLLSGSYVVSGSCKAQVVHIGEDNFATKIALEAKKYKKTSSNIIHSLNQIVKFTSYFILPLGVLLFVNSYFWIHLSFYQSVLATCTVLLGLLPKGVVLLTTLSLITGVVKLAQKQTLVQDLFCIETLSRVDTLCLDKTGTITEGNMQVCDFKAYSNTLPYDIDKIIGTYQKVLNDRNSTAVALQSYFKESISLEAIDTTAFSSDRKWSSICFKDIGTIYIGAPDFLIHDDALLNDDIQKFIDEGKRVILVAYTPEFVTQTVASNLTALALITLDDPIRKNAKRILDFFHGQEVDIKIISGDYPSTVAKVAEKAGLQNAQCIDANTLIEDQDYIDAVMQYNVFGRVLPHQKKKLVEALQAQGKMVAMSGDGVNDVLALKTADCSIAMACGSDAPKQISQIVLLNNDFASLPSVVMEGRRVINNITKTASLFLVKTIYSFLLSIGTVLFSIPYPFTPIQLSLISLFVEGIPAFLLALEPNQDKVKGNFLYTVITQAFPTAVIITVYTMLLHVVIAPFFELSTIEMTTLSLYVTGFTWLMQLFRVCQPFTLLRRVLWITMVVMFFGSAYFFRDFLSLTTLSITSWLIFAVLAVLCYPLQAILYKLICLVKIKDTK